MKYDYEAPQVIKELYELDYDTEDNCLDFEPYENFMSPEETASLLENWTGDKNYKGQEYRVFGRKASGCEYAIWLVKENVQLLEQPVVLLDSEGQAYTVATNYSDFLWVLIALEDEVNSSVKDYVLKNTTTPQRDIEDILHEANEKYDFYEYIWERVVYGK